MDLDLEHFFYTSLVALYNIDINILKSSLEDQIK